MNKIERVNNLHDKAMELAQFALLARVQGEASKVKQLSKDAFQYERDAAMLLFYDYDLEPTRSVLFRSAASLALNAESYKEAEEMVAYGLSGLNSYQEIAYELIELIDKLKVHGEARKILEVAKNLSSHATWYKEQGEFSQAKLLSELAVAIRERLLRNSGSVAQVML